MIMPRCLRLEVIIFEPFRVGVGQCPLSWQLFTTNVLPLWGFTTYSTPKGENIDRQTHVFRRRWAFGDASASRLGWHGVAAVAMLGRKTCVCQLVGGSERKRASRA